MSLAPKAKSSKSKARPPAEPEAPSPASKKRKVALPSTGIDSAWFNAALKASGRSQREAATLLGIESASLNRAIKGKRKWNIEELMSFAGYVGASATEILTRVGYTLPTKTAEIVGRVGEDARVSTNTKRKGERIESPSEVGPNCVCAILETARTRLDAFDGTAIFWKETRQLEPDAVGRFSVVETEDEPLPIVGVLRRLAIGKYRIEPFGGVASPVETASVLRAAPILWTKTQ
jgi:hypothetical protein